MDACSTLSRFFTNARAMMKDFVACVARSIAKYVSWEKPKIEGKLTDRLAPNYPYRPKLERV